MKLIDVASDPSIASLMELLGSLASLADPAEAQAALAADLRSSRTGGGGAGGSGGGGGGAGLPPWCLVLKPVSFDGGGRVAAVVLHARGPGIAPLPESPPTVLDGPLTSLLRSPVPKLALDVDLSADALPGPLAAIRPSRSAMAVPVFADQGPREWVLLLHADPAAFGPAELRDLILRTSLAGAVATNLQTARQLFQASLRVQADIDEVAEIQRGLLPARVPEVPGLSIAASYDAAGAAGGDLYDFVNFGDRLAVLIGDVSGHGPGAAVVMAMIHSILHAHPAEAVRAGPADVLAFVNRHLCEKRTGRAFTTAFLGFYDPATRVLSYARAGHNPPLLLPPDGPGWPLEAVGDLPLGIEATVEYEQTSVTLPPGATLILYTDGITEARSPDGEMFEPARIEAALTPRPEDAETALRRVRQALLVHTAGAPPIDDQTLIAIRGM